MAQKSALEKGKRLQAFIGLFFLIPPVLGVIFFVISVFGGNGHVPQMRNLRSKWSGTSSGNGGTTPIYLGLMAMVGGYLIKDALPYIFKDDKINPNA